MMAAKQKSFDDAADVAKEGGSGTASSSAPASAKSQCPSCYACLTISRHLEQSICPAPDASKGSWVCKGKGCTAPPYATWRECCIHLMAGDEWACTTTRTA